jgi:hypothetical protein
MTLALQGPARAATRTDVFELAQHADVRLVAEDVVAVSKGKKIRTRATLLRNQEGPLTVQLVVKRLHTMVWVYSFKSRDKAKTLSATVSLSDARDLVLNFKMRVKTLDRGTLKARGASECNYYADAGSSGGSAADAPFTVRGPDGRSARFDSGSLPDAPPSASQLIIIPASGVVPSSAFIEAAPGSSHALRVFSPEVVDEVLLGIQGEPGYFVVPVTGKGVAVVNTGLHEYNITVDFPASPAKAGSVTFRAGAIRTRIFGAEARIGGSGVALLCAIGIFACPPPEEAPEPIGDGTYTCDYDEEDQSYVFEVLDPASLLGMWRIEYTSSIGGQTSVAYFLLETTPIPDPRTLGAGRFVGGPANQNSNYIYWSTMIGIGGRLIDGLGMTSFHGEYDALTQCKSGGVGSITKVAGDWSFQPNSALSDSLAGPDGGWFVASKVGGQ